ncbi:sigma-70 family RNA polymerase sigma factor [Streptomyces sp. NBC_00006]|uniref:sigma-70 family RNA polymerase sigma factor n=1 Tax=Streptomyces sp. NBC_00006 TaxID=2975619 RepID=UPI00224F1FFA|nr:sigma-70 family RNA polymerase sigma factor [Streptomyces sp. NBC_00006]MCX5537119.1 sigma-70 family RNA polymerase sigma factor [Streptomyces sp. NBC_00006]
MADAEVLAARFEEHRPRLRAVAHRMLGSSAEADDVVQEAWLRLSRTDDADTIDNLAAWLTTVVSRICLNALRARATRREDPLEVQEHERGEGPVDPADEAVTADSLGLALMVVLDRLAPAERLAFVLHDLFTVPFDEIAPIVERTPAATRQLASRARRRVREADPRATEAADRERRREVVEAFLAATQGGDFEALLTVLDPEVVVRSDAAAIAMGSEPEVIGARAVASLYAGRAKAARLALVDGTAGVVWTHAGTLKVAFAVEVDLTTDPPRITGIELVADEKRLASMDVVPLRRRRRPASGGQSPDGAE